MVGVIAGNLRELRKRGLTAADLLALEKLAILASRGAGFVRVSDLGRLLGIGRSGAHYRLASLVAKGFVLRVGRCVILNVKALLSMSVDAVKARVCRVKELFSWQKRPKRSGSQTDTRQIERKGYEIGPLSVWKVGDSAADGRKIIGERKHGALVVPVWG